MDRRSSISFSSSHRHKILRLLFTHRHAIICVMKLSNMNAIRRTIDEYSFDINHQSARRQSLWLCDSLRTLWCYFERNAIGIWDRLSYHRVNMSIFVIRLHQFVLSYWIHHTSIRFTWSKSTNANKRRTKYWQRWNSKQLNMPKDKYVFFQRITHYPLLIRVYAHAQIFMHHRQRQEPKNAPTKKNLLV